MLKVVNGYKSGWIGSNKIYIGRQNNKLNLKTSVLANPYSIGKDGNREEVIYKYRVWLNEQVKNKTNVYDYLINLARLNESTDVFELVCYCKPQSCHGDIIINAITYILKQLEE